MEECTVAAPIRVKCEPGCVGFKKALDACAVRIETLKEKHPDANCELQYFDYQACLDKCVRHLSDEKTIRDRNRHGSLLER